MLEIPGCADLLVRSEWSGAFLKSILAGEFAPYDPVQFHLDGDDFECPSGVATPLALIFHELTTNAAKYGALSAPHGQIGLTWLEHDDQVEFDWVESGGPQPMAPQREGFGSVLLRKGLNQFDCAVEIRFMPTGLRCELSLSLPRPRQAETVDLEADRPPLPPSQRRWRARRRRNHNWFFIRPRRRTEVSARTTGCPETVEGRP